MDAAAAALGMASDEIQAALKSGSTLGDLAAAKGVSTDDLTKALAAALKADKPAGAPELSDDQLTQMASTIVAGKRPAGPPPGARGPGGEAYGENPLAAEFARQAKDLVAESGDYGRTQRRTGLLADFSA